MKHLKLFENYYDDREKQKKFIDEQTGVEIDVDGETITWEDLRGKYRGDIVNFYGDFYDVNLALYHLHDVQGYWENGGEIYRIIWLDDISEFKKEELGFHWVSDPNDCESIVFSLGPNDLTVHKKDENGKLLRDKNGQWIFDHVVRNTKKPYMITAYTPPHNVRIPFGYFNNLNEMEIYVKEENKLKFKEIEKY